MKLKDNFPKIVSIPHAFDHNEYRRSIMVFSKENRDCEIAMENGATLVGGLHLIKNIQKGDVGLHEFKFILKKKFLNVKDGTSGINIKPILMILSNILVCIFYKLATRNF